MLGFAGNYCTEGRYKIIKVHVCMYMYVYAHVHILLCGKILGRFVIKNTYVIGQLFCHGVVFLNCFSISRDKRLILVMNTMEDVKMMQFANFKMGGYYVLVNQGHLNTSLD